MKLTEDDNGGNGKIARVLVYTDNNIHRKRIKVHMIDQCQNTSLIRVGKALIIIHSSYIQRRSNYRIQSEDGHFW